MDPCYVPWAEFLQSLWSEDSPARVLDVCCGTGLMTTELVARGHDVTGVDASEAMLARARERLGPSVPLIHCVLPHLPLPGPFDAAVSTLDGLNYLNLDDLRGTFTALAAVLREGGWLVFDVHTDATLSFLSDHPLIEGEEHGSTFRLSTTLEGRTCHTTIEFSGEDPRSSFTERHTQHLHADDDLRDALRDAGFTDIRVLDEYTDAPATSGTLRATWVARRSQPVHDWPNHPGRVPMES